jgi:hypothetical protein
MVDILHLAGIDPDSDRCVRNVNLQRLISLMLKDILSSLCSLSGTADSHRKTWMIILPGLDLLLNQFGNIRIQPFRKYGSVVGIWVRALNLKLHDMREGWVGDGEVDCEALR